MSGRGKGGKGLGRTYKKQRTYQPLKFDSVPPPKIPFYSVWVWNPKARDFDISKTCFSRTNFQVTSKLGGDVRYYLNDDKVFEFAIGRDTEIQIS